MLRKSMLRKSIEAERRELFGKVVDKSKTDLFHWLTGYVKGMERIVVGIESTDSLRLRRMALVSREWLAEIELEREKNDK